MELAKFIDHTYLQPDAQKKDIDKILSEAKQYHFASVCISPIWVSYAHKELADSDVNVVTVIGFPEGATPTSVKAFETKQAIADGADEVDMVIPTGFLKDGEYDYVENDIRAVVEAAQGKTTKVIIEACLLTDAEKVKACELAKKAGADFVKTSTGFGTGGATEEDVRLMVERTRGEVKVKAAGGIRTLDAALRMIDLGVSRIGSTASVKIMEEFLAR